MKTLLYNADIVTPEETFRGFVLIEDERIVRVGKGEDDVPWISLSKMIDFGGDLLMAGAIDTHVHFRDPGLTEKGDMETESRAAVAGGVTSFIDMPNTKPQTVSFSAVEDKLDMAAEKSWANYGFFIGATSDNAAELLEGDYSKCAGVKVFLGSSTGNMCLDDDETLRRLAEGLPESVPMAFHAEDNEIISKNAKLAADALGEVPINYHPLIRSREACLTAARRVEDLARETGRKCVLMHLSTAEELELGHDLPNLYRETCPQYLMFDVSDYDRLGALIKCNPAIKSRRDRDVLRKGVADGRITHISTDHAPHLLKDKEGDALHATSGMPGIQYSLPLMLSLFEPEKVTELMSRNPALIYGIVDRGEIKPGMYADLVRVSRRRVPTTDSEGLPLEPVSKCGWTPYRDLELPEVVTTWVNGLPVYDRRGFISANRRPLPLRFNP